MDSLTLVMRWKGMEGKVGDRKSAETQTGNIAALETSYECSIFDGSIRHHQSFYIY